MDLRTLSTSGVIDFSRYTMPVSYELAGQVYTLAFDDGEIIDLAFAKAFDRKLYTGGGSTGISYDCFKIQEAVFLVSFETLEVTKRVGYTFVMDTEKALVTLAAAEISSSCVEVKHKQGVIGGASIKERHVFTKDLDGNTLEWTFGIEEKAVIRLAYEDASAFIRFPLSQVSAEIPAVSDFSAVKIKDGLYFQTMVVRTKDTAAAVSLLSNYVRVLSAGTIFGRSASGGDFYLATGAYGRFTQ